jgi:hypothetical protein
LDGQIDGASVCVLFFQITIDAATKVSLGNECLDSTGLIRLQPVASRAISTPGGLAPADLLRYRDATDLRHARTCLGAEDGALLVQVWIMARKLIDDDWASVVRIAEALQRHGRLTG